MARSAEKIPDSPPHAEELEPYHRLVELQKQIIALAQQNERAKNACDELREKMVAEVCSQPGAPRNLRQKANRAFGHLPGMAMVKSNLVSLVIKEQSTC